jgi:hypothetical protein
MAVETLQLMRTSAKMLAPISSNKRARRAGVIANNPVVRSRQSVLGSRRLLWLYMIEKHIQITSW